MSNFHHLWTWTDKNPDALTDPQRVRTPSITEYWKPLAEDMDESAGIEAEYYHKNNRKREVEKRLERVYEEAVASNAGNDGRYHWSDDDMSDLSDIDGDDAY
ncbi:hypothetical protein ACHQM5_013503 [Ranunculus cassubicifolius]